MTGLKNILNVFEDLRRSGYVSALMLNSEMKKIAGIYGFDIPREILWALDIVPINIYSIDDTNITEAEKALEKNYCSLIKASYGYAMLDKCPYIHFSDVIIGNDHCPQKVELIEKLSDFKKAYIINEHMDENSLINEYKKLICFLEHEFSIELTENKLYEAIKKNNEINIAIDEIIQIYMTKTNLISCLDLFNIIYGSQFILNLDEKYNKLSELKDVLTNLVNENKFEHTKTYCTVMITGAPLGGLSDKILKPLSDMNDIKFMFSSFCEGENYNIADVSKDLLVSLAQKYLKNNENNKLKYLADKYETDAIISINLTECSKIEAFELPNKQNINIITDYFYNDSQIISQKLHSFLKNTTATVNYKI